MTSIHFIHYKGTQLELLTMVRDILVKQQTGK